MKLEKDRGVYRSMGYPRICDKCKKKKNTTRFGWKFHDFHKKYFNSGLRIIHAKNYDVCEKCLKRIIKNIENNF